PEFETLVINDDRKSSLAHRAKLVLERDVLPAFLAGRRWFAERGNPAITTHVAATISFDREGLAIALVEAKGKESANYVLPLMVKWSRFDTHRGNPNALAAIRRGPREGTLLDAASDPIFIRFLLQRLQSRQNLEADGLRLEFLPTSRFEDG